MLNGHHHHIGNVRAQGDMPLTLPSVVCYMASDPTESQWNTFTQQIFIKHQPNFHVGARDRESNDEIHIDVASAFMSLMGF